jgi:hypothetical protein
MTGYRGPDKKQTIQWWQDYATSGEVHMTPALRSLILRRAVGIEDASSVMILTQRNGVWMIGALALDALNRRSPQALYCSTDPGPIVTYAYKVGDGGSGVMLILAINEDADLLEVPESLRIEIAVAAMGAGFSPEFVCL